MVSATLDLIWLELTIATVAGHSALTCILQCRGILAELVVYASFTAGRVVHGSVNHFQTYFIFHSDSYIDG